MVFTFKSIHNHAKSVLHEQVYFRLAFIGCASHFYPRELSQNVAAAPACSITSIYCLC